MKHDVRAVVGKFDVHGEFVSAEPYGTGHINDTYAVTVGRDGSQERFILQRINHEVFKNPVAVIENIEKVTEHQRRVLEKEGDGDTFRRALTLVPSNDGKLYCRDAQGSTWRAYYFIEDTRVYLVPERPEQAYEAAKAFGRFHRQVANLPASELHETIPDFHNTPKRFEALERAIEKDPVGRAAVAAAEIEFALSRKAMTGLLQKRHESGLMPARVVHNDTKVDNVLMDERTGEGVCVIDLDTVMPGLVLYDFGDMVRSGTRSALEDEKDLSKVDVRMPMFEALAKGYLEFAGDLLNDAEKEDLVFSGRLVTLEIGIRFLTDYLLGDTYFKVHREGHNLDRCRVQFKHLRAMEDNEDAMNRIVRRVLE